MIFWQISTTLDGFMEGPNGELDRTAQVIDDDFEKYASEMLQSIGGMILGRKTYELFNSYWPNAEGPDAERMNDLPKLVFSRTLDSVDWNNAKLADGRLAESVEEFRRTVDGDVAVFGSSTLASDLSRAELIDEFRIFVTPFVIARGKPAFVPEAAEIELDLTRSVNWRSGTVALFYQTTKEKTT